MLESGGDPGLVAATVAEGAAVTLYAVLMQRCVPSECFAVTVDARPIDTRRTHPASWGFSDVMATLR